MFRYEQRNTLIIKVVVREVGVLVKMYKFSSNTEICPNSPCPIIPTSTPHRALQFDYLHHRAADSLHGVPGHSGAPHCQVETELIQAAEGRGGEDSP